MSITSSGARLAKLDRRKHRRYDLQYPVHVIYRAGDSVAHLNALSKNVGVDGMLLRATSPIPLLSRARFVIALAGGALTRSIELAGEGKVLRVQREPVQTEYEIVIECMRPIAQIEEYCSVPN